MSVQRNAPACVQNVSPIAKSLSSIVAVRLSRIVTPSPADLIQPGAFRGVFSLPLEASVRGQVSTRGGRGGGTIASGPAAPSTIGMMTAEVHGRSSPHRTPWLRSLIAADTCADVRVFVGRRLLPAGPPAEERMGGRRGA